MKPLEACSYREIISDGRDSVMWPVAKVDYIPIRAHSKVSYSSYTAAVDQLLTKFI